MTITNGLFYWSYIHTKHATSCVLTISFNSILSSLLCHLAGEYDDSLLELVMSSGTVATA